MIIEVIEDALDFINRWTQSSIIKKIQIKDNKLINEEHKEYIDEQLFNLRVIGEQNTTT